METPQRDICQRLRRDFPIKPNKSDSVLLPQQGVRPRGTIAEESVVTFLHSARNPVVNRELFVPRANPAKIETEYAWYAIYQTYAKMGDERASVDDFFNELMQAWVRSLPTKMRKDILRKAQRDWTTLMEMESREVDPTAWPFVDIEVVKAA
jgi:hypothetical protein